MRLRAFTLIELLVVVAIISVLVAILVPSLGATRARARATVCLAQLKGLGTALTLYNAEHDGFIVPSFNMNGTSGGPSDPLDGWGPILDRDGLVPGARERARNAFYCPETLDIEGMAGGQTGADPDKPRGWMDWPSIRVSNAVNTPTTIPQRGLHRIIRVSYWINAENQFGAAADPLNNRYYTLSVGYGPTPTGMVTRPRRVGTIRKPHALIALADGVYAGRQEDARLNGTDGVTNSRVGYRHAKGQVANAAFADGHAEPVKHGDFPRAPGTVINLLQSQVENTGLMTVYADPTMIR